jgi:thiopurine S-methyltransferase
VDASFWRDRWARNQIGFHEPQANPLLVAHFGSLSLPTGARIFIPLCGKSLDIPWLLSRGHPVVGVELSEIAVQQLFASLGVTPTIKANGTYTRYSVPGIDILQGDFFDLSDGDVGPIGAVYDRAALIALPESMRLRYAVHLEHLAHRATQLLITLRYDQHLVPGPPFSVTGGEVAELYRNTYRPTLLASADVIDGLKGKYPATEEVWLLRPVR